MFKFTSPALEGLSSGKQLVRISGGSSFGPIRFGASKEAVQTALSKFKLNGSFLKTKSSSNPALNYGSFHVYFINDKCNAVELFDDTLFVPVVNSLALLPCTLKDLVNKFLKMGSDSWEFVIGNGGFISRQRSTGIWINGDKVESVLVGEPGYYDKD